MRKSGISELGACALASVWFNLWNCFMIGAMTAVDTILSNLFGADKFEEYGESLLVEIYHLILCSKTQRTRWISPFTKLTAGIWTGNSLIIGMSSNDNGT